jgi:hypothetical protein
MVQICLNEKELGYIISLIEYDDGIHPIDIEQKEMLEYLKSQLEGYEKILKDEGDA